jgi:hypothetical protein
MEIIIVLAVFLLWLVLGGFVALLVCPLLKQNLSEASESHDVKRPREAPLPHASSSIVNPPSPGRA